MDRISTNTTDFKRVLKTTTDILTNTEMKEHNLDIEIEYGLGRASLLTRHPVHDLVIYTDFPIADASKEEFTRTIKLGELSTRLRKYRKKEELFIHFEEDGVTFRTEKELVYKANNSEATIKGALTDISNDINVNRKSFIDSFRISGSITRASFHDSTNVVKIAYAGNNLHLYATNLAQLAVMTMITEQDQDISFDVDLSKNLLTKVRNTIERGKGKKLSISNQDEWLTLKTDTNYVRFKGTKGIPYLNFKQLISSIDWEEKIYTFNTLDNKEFLTKRYDLWNNADKEKDEELLKKYQNISFEIKGIELVFSEEQTNQKLYTRDINTLFNHLPSKMDVAYSEQAILLKLDDQYRRLMLLIPYL